MQPNFLAYGVGCSDPECPKNYVVFTHDEVNGFQAFIQLVHFKNGETKGLKKIPVDKHLIEPLILQFKAWQACAAATCSTLFFNRTFQQPKDQYFITLCGDALTIPRRGRYTSRVPRGQYETLMRDFIHKSGFLHKILEMARKDVDQAAADAMLSSIFAVDSSYDSGDVERSYYITQPFWPLFKEYVKKDYEANKTRRPWNFEEELPSIDGLTWNALG